MDILSRTDKIKKLLPDLPKFRFQQIDRALFNRNYNGWKAVTVLSKLMREKLENEVPWISASPITILESKKHDTFKAVLQASDKQKYETVLMKNARNEWTLCVSSQIGCAMKCVFCATGTMGLKRSLIADEIVDQYRFWNSFLRTRPDCAQRISNMVFMGMGEPMANYDAVCSAIQTLIHNTDLGPTRITVSTVGILPQLERLLTDPKWPNARIAISLHSPYEARRKEIVPTTVPNFHEKLVNWANRYHASLGSKRRHITFEYTLIANENDSEELANALGKYIQKTGSSKINIIPYNPVPGKPYAATDQTRIERFKKIIRTYNIIVTQRKTMGDDIAAACGQLVYKQ